MIPKSPTLILAGLLAAVLIAFSLAGCQKEEALEPQLRNDSYDDALNFRADAGACDPGVTILELYNAGANDDVVRWYNNSNEDDESFKQEQDIMGDPLPSTLLQFSANPGYEVYIQNQQMGVKDDGSGNAGGKWITPGEILYIKVGTDLTPDGWRFLTGSLYIEHQANTTVRLQMRSKGQNVQPAVVKSYTAAGFDRLSLSLFYHWDEVAISVDGATGGVNVPLKAAQAERQCFIITNNTNHYLAMRSRAGIYFWNSMVSKDHNRLDKPNHQYVVGGEFTQTANGDEWVTDLAFVGVNPGYLNTQVTNPFGPVGPSAGAGTDRAIDAGDALSIEIGPDVAPGMEFINAVIPIRTPAGGGTPVVALLKGGVPVGAPITLTQAPNTNKYHLIGLTGQTFDQIVLSCSEGSYWFFTDYWSVARFSMCDASMEKTSAE